MNCIITKVLDNSIHHYQWPVIADPDLNFNEIMSEANKAAWRIPDSVPWGARFLILKDGIKKFEAKLKREPSPHWHITFNKLPRFTDKIYLPLEYERKAISIISSQVNAHDGI